MSFALDARCVPGPDPGVRGRGLVGYAEFCGISNFAEPQPPHTCPAMISCRMPIIPSYRSCKPSQYMAITGAGIAGVKMVKKGW